MEFSSSISRPAKRRTTLSNPCAVWLAFARSAIWERLIRWRLAFWSLRSGAPLVSLAFTRAAASATPARCDSVSRPIPTIRMEKRSARIPLRRSIAEQLESLAAQFVGKIQQVPPAFSAKKIRGRPAHELARKHKPVKLEPVEVEVYEFRLTAWKAPSRDSSSSAAPGTYVRSLAHDLGKASRRRSASRRNQSARPSENLRSIRQFLSTTRRGSESGKLRRPRDSLLKTCFRNCRAPRFFPSSKNACATARNSIFLFRKFNRARRLLAQGAPAELDSGDWKPSRLRVFNQQGQLIAIAEPVVPRTYQPVLVLEATP